jgi:demethylmenaquinone methyltransferase/2-methoxy-6-polyprenyl-1,4-benzoquinol methylase
MANEYYNPGEQRAAKVSDLFATVARRYDLMNDLQSFGLHRVWKRRLVRMAGARPGEQALDLCCGTGDIAFALARRGASVTGLDFSEPMLVVAEARRWRRGRRGQGAEALAGRAPNPHFVKGDAQQIPFPENTFEIVTVGYGLRNLADWKTGLREMQRVAKPGGRLLVLDFGKPDNSLWRGIYFGYLRCLVPVLGGMVCGNSAAYAYILESLMHYPAQRGVAAGMIELGLTGVRVLNLLGGVMSINYGEKPDPGRDSLRRSARENTGRTQSPVAMQEFESRCQAGTGWTRMPS